MQLSPRCTAEGLVQVVKILLMWSHLAPVWTTLAGIPKYFGEKSDVLLCPLIITKEMERALMSVSARVSRVSGLYLESPATLPHSLQSQIGSCSLPQITWAFSSVRVCLILT